MPHDSKHTTVRLTHHISAHALSLRASPLKAWMCTEGIISLAGGSPPSTNFPFESLSARILKPAQAYSATRPPAVTNAEYDFDHVEIPFDRSAEGTIDVRSALQYTNAHGLPNLTAILRKLTAHAHVPGYPDWTTLMNTGSTDGIFKSLSTFCNPGECVLIEEYTYTGFMTAMCHLDVKPVPVPMDSDGITPDGLSRILANWSPELRGGMKRPHVLYTIPVGQNPTGIVMSEERKRTIYQLCCLYDIIIIEDDPYHFFQYPPFENKSHKETGGSDQACTISVDDGLYPRELSPSFLRFDTQGRVVRLDTFSKTIAPGCRLGWFTCNAVFAEYLSRMVDVSTQAPCGFSQALVTSLLTSWGVRGYLGWLRGLKMQYTTRRNSLLHSISAHFDIAEITTSQGVVHLAKRTDPTGGDEEAKALFSYIPPRGGMFLWIRIHVEHHPLFRGFSDSAGAGLAASRLAEKLWLMLIEHKLLVMLGKYFSFREFDLEDERSGDDDQIFHHQHLRLNFCNLADANVQIVGETFSRVIAAFFQLRAIDNVWDVC